MKKKKINFFPFILFLLITIFLFGKALIPSPNQIISAGDIKHIYYPYREFLKSSLSLGQIPFWNPFLFSGTPFIAHPYTQFFYPTTLLFLFLPSNFYFSFILALHIFLAAILMYIALKKFTDYYSALIGGIIYGFNGYFVSRVNAGHVDYVISSALLPIIFLYSYEFIGENNRKALVLGGIFLCLQIFTGLISMTFYIFLIVGIFNLFITKISAEKIFQTLIKLIIFFALGFGLSAVYFIPAYQFISKTIRGTGLPYNQASLGSSTWQSLLMFINPDILGSDFNKSNFFHGPPPDYIAHLYFIGIIPIIILSFILIYFLIKSLIFKKIIPIFNKKFLALFFITIISILLALGPNSPVNLHFLLWKTLKIYQTTRLPVRHLIIAVFTLSVMTGIILHKIKSDKLKILLTILITVELLAFGKKFIFPTNLPSLLPENDQILNTIIKEKELMRILPDFTLNSPVREKLSFASPLVYRYFSTSGYTPAILSSYYDYIDRINGNFSPSIDKYNSEITPSFPYLSGISFLNVKYIIVDKTADLLTDRKDNYQLIVDTSLYRIYKNNNYLHRFFFVGNAKVYDNDTKLTDGLLNDQADFDELIIINAKDSQKIKHLPDCQDFSNTKIETVKYEINSIILKINAPCNGFISSSEVYYPGWTAKIDNKSSNMILSNSSFRAINVPRGEHTLTFSYQPTIFYLAGSISLACLLLSVYIWRSK